MHGSMNRHRCRVVVGVAALVGMCEHDSRSAAAQRVGDLVGNVCDLEGRPLIGNREHAARTDWDPRDRQCLVPFPRADRGLPSRADAKRSRSAVGDDHHRDPEHTVELSAATDRLVVGVREHDRHVVGRECAGRSLGETGQQLLCALMGAGHSLRRAHQRGGVVVAGGVVVVAGGVVVVAGGGVVVVVVPPVPLPVPVLVPEPEPLPVDEVLLRSQPAETRPMDMIAAKARCRAFIVLPPYLRKGGWTAHCARAGSTPAVRSRRALTRVGRACSRSERQRTGVVPPGLSLAGGLPQRGTRRL